MSEIDKRIEILADGKTIHGFGMLDLPSIESEIEKISERLKKEKNVPESELRKLYELIGLSMQKQFGPSIQHNPCSVESISKTVLRMTESLTPCRFLNVGMGGYPFVDIELIRRGFEVTSVEYSNSLTQLALKVFESMKQKGRCLVADGMKLPFKDSSFEACLCSETLEHIADDRAVVSEINRVLKPGGTFILTVPCLLAALGFEKRLLHWIKNKNLILHPTHLREYTFFSAKRLVCSNFSIIRWYAVPFTTEPFQKMPVEKTLSMLVALPGFKHFSLSMAFMLKKLEPERKIANGAKF